MTVELSLNFIKLFNTIVNRVKILKLNYFNFNNCILFCILLTGGVS